MKSNITIIILILLISSCKYEDGPLFSVFSPSTRVIGDYTIESATKNGQDQMNEVNALHIEAMHFYSEEDLTVGGFSFSVTFSDGSHYNDADWSLLNNDKDLYVQALGCFSSSAIPPPFAPVPGFISTGDCSGSPLPLWEILKLSNNKLWLSINFLDNDYEVHLKKI